MSPSKGQVNSRLKAADSPTARSNRPFESTHTTKNFPGASWCYWTRYQRAILCTRVPAEVTYVWVAPSGLMGSDERLRLAQRRAQARFLWSDKQIVQGTGFKTLAEPLWKPLLSAEGV